MKDIQSRFQAVAAEYKKLKANCAKQVARQQWSTWIMFALRPFYFQSMRFKPGRWLAKEPANKDGKCEYSFDADDRVLCLREGTESRGQFYETYYTYGDNTIECIRFNYSREKPVEWLEQFHYRRGQLASYEFCGREVIVVERYEYDGDRVVKCHCRRQDWKPGSGARGVAEESIVEAAYDDLGRLERIDCVYPKGAPGIQRGERDLVYQRPKKGESIKELGSLIEEQLCRLIPAAVAAERVRGPAYCILLGYDCENPDRMLPPMVAVGLEKDRVALVRAHGKEAKFLLWNPDEFPRRKKFVELADVRLTKACHLFSQQLAARQSLSPAVELLNRVSARLGELDWRGKLETTDDFVVVAVDLEGQRDVLKNLKKSAPQALVAALKAKSYV